MISTSDLPDRLNSEGLDHAARGSDPLAQSAFRKACALAPSHLGAIGNLANAETRRMSLEAALRHYGWGRALAPHLAQLHLMLATAEIHLGALDRASASLRRAMALSPAYGNALTNLGTLLARRAREADGIILFRRALSCDPRSDLAFAGCIQALSRGGHYEPGSQLVRRAIVLHPSSALVQAAVAEFHQTIADLPVALRHLRRAIALDLQSWRLHQQLLFGMVLDPGTTDASLFNEYRRWARRHMPAPVSRPAPVDRNPDRPLNVGYLSADLYDHPVAYLVEDLIIHHDRAQVRPWLFSAGARNDATGRRLAAAAHAWRPVATLSDDDAARLIRESGIDILVSLAGHTGDNRLPIVARRPAPVQVNLHDLSTSGLDQMDYWLTDRHLHPDDTTEGHTERLWRLESLYLHRWPERVPAASPLPALMRGFVTFGCFASPAKLNGRVLALWAQVLREVPGSRILFAYRQAFADPLLRDRFRSLLGTYGITHDRIGFDLRRLARAEHLARVAETDISLDPFPFTGGTGTFEALSVGIPVVTLAGTRFAARCGVSHLAQVGLRHLIAASEEEYRKVAVSLASDLGSLAKLREGLPARVRTSPLTNAALYAKAVDEAYRGMWRRYCAESS